MRPLSLANDEHGPLPLRFPVSPHPDESLPGLIARATRENVLEMTAIVLGRAGLKLLHPGTVCQAPETALKQLASVLRCEAGAVLSRAHHYCAERTRGGPVRFGDAIVYREDLLLEKRRIAPITLERTSNYHRASWLLGLLPYCPISLERLVDQCPRCPDKRLGWRRSWGIANCEWCGELIPPSDGLPLERDLAAGYRLFADLFSIDPSARSAALATFPEEVQALDPRTLLACTLQLGATCRAEPLRLKRNTVHSIPAPTLGSIVSNGAVLMQGWPERVRGWTRSEALRLDGDYPAVTSLRRSLRRLGLRHSARPEQRVFIRAGLPDMFDSFDRSFADPADIVLGNEAARMTGLDLAEIRALREAGLIEAWFEHGKNRLRRQYNRRQVEQLTNALRGSRPSTYLEWRLGLPLYAIEQLCCLNIVEEENDAGVRLIRPDLQLTRSSIENLLTGLSACASKAAAPVTAIPLTTASRRIGGKLKPWGAILSALLDGEVPFWIGPGTNFARRARVRPSDLVRFDHAVFDETTFPRFSFSCELTQSNAEEILNIDAMQIRIAKHEKLLEYTTKGTSVRFDRAAVLSLADQILSTGEIASRTGQHPRTVLNVMRKIRAPRLAFGWERCAVDTNGLSQLF